MQMPANAPAWLQLAWREIGNHEVGDNRGPAVQRYIELAKTGELGDPWCAIFANAMLEEAGVRGTRSPSSQSFRHDPNFTEIEEAALGCIVVFWRGSRSSGLGHVGFYIGERKGFIYTLGGNESDMVQIEFLSSDASNFGLVGYYWPHFVAMPKLGAIELGADTPAHVLSPGAAPAPVHAVPPAPASGSPIAPATNDKLIEIAKSLGDLRTKIDAELLSVNMKLGLIVQPAQPVPPPDPKVT